MKFGRDPETVQALREFLATPALLGPRVVDALSDDQVVDQAEHVATKIMDALPGLTAAIQEAATAWGQIAKNLQCAFREIPGVASN